MRRVLGDSVSIRGEGGATLIESAIAITLLLLLLVVSIEFLRLSHAVLTVRYVSARVMRQVVLGTMNSTEIVDEVVNTSKRFGLALGPGNVAMCRLESYPCTWGVVDAGAPDALMILEIGGPMRSVTLSAVEGLGLTFRDGNFTSRVIGKIEPRQ